MKVWGHKWAGKCVVIHCDNQAVVTVLNSGRTRDPVLATITRNIALISATKDIELRVVHILGKHNVIADNLSRLAISPQYRHKLFTLIPYHKWIQPPTEALNLDPQYLKFQVAPSSFKPFQRRPPLESIVHWLPPPQGRMTPCLGFLWLF